MPAPAVMVTIAGVDRTSDVRTTNTGITISDLLDQQPNTARLRTWRGAKPATGAEVKIGLGGVSTLAELLFAGHIREVAQIYEGDKPANIAYDVSAIDYTWLLNRRKVIKYYPSQSATAIVLDLIASFTSGFTTASVVAGLPTIDEMTFTNEDMDDALTRIARAIGGYWYIDYLKVVHFFLTEATGNPTIITTADPQGAAEIVHQLDLSQIRTRVYVEGGGASAAAEIPVGSNKLYVDDASWYSASGGTVVSGAQRITYTGKSTTVLSPGTPLANPSSAPAVAVPNGSGPLIGAYRYKYTWVNATGETLGSSASATANPAAPTVPSLPTVAESDTAGVLVGTYLYKISFVTANGETLAGTASSAATPDAWPTPSAPTVAENAANGLLVGSYLYKISFLTALGETLVGTASAAVTPDIWTPPGAPSGVGSQDSTTIGPLYGGAYNWAVTFVTDQGETTLGTATGNITPTSHAAPTAPTVNVVAGGTLTASSNYLYKTTNVSEYGETAGGTATATHSTTGTNKQFDVTPLQGPTGTRARRIYRTKAGGSTYYFVTEINNNTVSVTYRDTIPDDQLSATTAPSTSTFGGYRMTVTSIPTGPTGTIARRLYRTLVGGSTYYFVAELQDNTTTSYLDLVPAASLSALAPVVNTAGGEKVDLTAIPTGLTGTLGRRIYRTKAGGATYFLVAELADNTTTTYTDNIPDSALTQAPPIVATAGGEQISLSSIPTAPASVGALARKIYRTKAGGSAYYYVDQLSDNTTTTYTDNTPDDQLNTPVPLVSTAGGQTVNVTSILAGPTGTTNRKLYRTKAGGADYYYLASLNDNTTTTYLDTLGDESLGELAPAVNTSGGAAVTVSTLTGVPTGGAGRVLYLIPKGAAINILITRNDTTAQTALAALVGGDGIHEHYIQDNRLAQAECEARGDAELDAFKSPIETVTLTTRDPNARTGKTVELALSAPTSINGSYKIQTVQISHVGTTSAYPLRSLTASSQRYSLEELLRIRRTA